MVARIPRALLFLFYFSFNNGDYMRWGARISLRLSFILSSLHTMVGAEGGVAGATLSSLRLYDGRP